MHCRRAAVHRAVAKDGGNSFTQFCARAVQLRANHSQRAHISGIPIQVEKVLKSLQSTATDGSRVPGNPPSGALQRGCTINAARTIIAPRIRRVGRKNQREDYRVVCRFRSRQVGLPGWRNGRIESDLLDCLEDA